MGTGKFSIYFPGKNNCSVKIYDVNQLLHNEYRSPSTFIQTIYAIIIFCQEFKLPVAKYVCNRYFEFYSKIGLSYHTSYISADLRTIDHIREEEFCLKYEACCHKAIRQLYINNNLPTI